jgi:alpha-D-xyloside xylohydrolase
MTGLAGCADEPDQDPPPPPFLWAGGPMIQQSTPLDMFVLLPENEVSLVLLKFPADGFQLGVVDQVDTAATYDPADIFVNPSSAVPAGLAWHSAVKIEETAGVLAESIEFALTYDNGLSARLRFVAENTDSFEGSGFKVSLIPDDASHVAYIRLRPRCYVGAKLLGLGQYDAKHDLRGLKISSKTSAAPPGEQAPTPQPFLAGDYWGISVASAAPGLFSLETTEPDLIDIVYGTGSTSAQGLVFHVFGALQGGNIPKIYAQISGHPAQ